MSMELREQLIETAIAMNADGINRGTSGNLSVRMDGGFLITPSAINYSELTPENIVAMNLEGDWEGSVKPSSEWRFHRDIYRQRADARAILHAHPVFCATLACMGTPIPAFHYMVAVAGGRDIRCAAYATFGTQELSDHVLSALTDRKACLMANHGLLCLEHDLPRTLALALEIEQLAHVYYQCLAVGKPVILDDEEMETVLEKFSNYGQWD
ncbi:MAG: class II aldolase/adducin family protein [Xanthomonadales bacterium]